MSMPHVLTGFRATADYIRWADGRMLKAARTIPDPAEYHRDRGISHGSVHKLLLHMMGSQAGWLKTFTADRPPALPDTSPAGCPDLDAIEKAWPTIHDALARYLDELTQADLDRPIHFVRNGLSLALPLGHAIAHLLDHATYHRGQLNTLIRLAGGQRIWVSYWIYALRTHPQPSPATEADFLQ